MLLVQMNTVNLEIGKSKMTVSEIEKTILCYGDSNTWGYIPGSGLRYPKHQRWTSVLQEQLGDEFSIISEGMNGRTTVFEDPLEAGRSGLAACIPIMASHQPLDFVIIMLGTNDTKTRFHVSAREIALGLSRLVKTIQLGNYEKASLQLPIGIIAPPIIQEAYAEEVFRGAQEKSKLLASYYEEIAQDLGCYFFNAATVVQTSIIDGVHLEGEAHRNLGLAVAQWVMNI